MPIKESAAKCMRKNKPRHLRNMDVKSELKTRNKKLHLLVSEGKKEQATQLLKELISKLDKAAKKHIIHKNTASRKKSRLMKMFNSQITIEQKQKVQPKAEEV